ncbi:hypothetical protein SESBI_09351 [Sesbania bispinosa]|nr:hypothetical protein SESBI_09351 [Sesbania bispinosa]
MAGREDVRTAGKKPRSSGGPDWHGGARLAARRGCFWTATADGQWRCCRRSEMEAGRVVALSADDGGAAGEDNSEGYGRAAEQV